MSQVPANQRLYSMVVFQAKQKYRVYPSPGASHWVHKRYLELGGKFKDSAVESAKKEAIRRFIERRRMEHNEHGERDHKHMNHKGKKHGDKE
jgi:hypothetical protein